MKIIVNEMPKSAIDCTFIGGLNTCLLTHEECGLYDGECQHLKPITDFKADAIEEYRQRLNNAFEPVEEHEQMELEVVIADVNRLAKVLKEQK